MRKYFHQSYILVAFCLGIVMGAVLGVVFRWSFLSSPIWVICALLLLIYAYFCPTHTFLILAFLAGNIIIFVRVADALKSGVSSMDQWPWVVQIRDWFASRISQQLPETESGLGIAYLLGIRDNLPTTLKDGLRIVGLTHIVVASGAHLSIITDAVRKIFGKISRFASLLFATIFTILFMVMVGWTPSILRAGIMAILSLAMWYVGRKFAPWRLILITMSITLIINPTYLTDLGWILSFASFAGIMLLSPALQQFFFAERKIGFIAETVLTSIAATLATIPVTLYFFGSLSLISIIANLLILPTLPYAMIATFAVGITAGAGVLGDLCKILATWILDFHINIINFLGGETSFLISIPKYNPLIFLLYLPILAPFIIGLFKRKMLKLRKSNINFGENMSGHSKWATTKRQKAVVDAKRGALFTKIGNQIAIAARSGTDPAMNPSLAMVLEKARLANMPKANIERAIARVADKSAAALLEETYEAYGPGGVGIIIEVATDNKNRTMPEVRHTLDKCGGRMADPGSVMFQFTRKGVIEISDKGEEALMAALEAGAEDASEEDEGIVIYTAASDLMKVRAALIEAGMTVTSAELQYVPNNTVPVEGETAEKLEKLLDSVDDLDDVTAVHTNAE